MQNLGTVLADLAGLMLKVKQDRSESDRLFQVAYDKFACSLALRRDDPKALNRWGNALCEQAALIGLLGEMVNMEEGCRLYDSAGQKYKRASELEPSDALILYNWGNQLRNLAKLQMKIGKDADAEKSLTLALGKYRACCILRKNDPLTLDAHINWGCALLGIGKLKKGKDSISFYEQARQLFLAAGKLSKYGGIVENERRIEYEKIVEYNIEFINSLREEGGETEYILGEVRDL